MAQDGIGVCDDLLRQIRSGGAPGLDPEVVEKILGEYFCGKRDSVRTCAFVDLKVTGKRGTFAGMAVDISSTGMLLRVLDPDFAAEAEMDQLMPYTARVWDHFEGGFTVRFAEAPQAGVLADVIRVTGYCGRGSSLILIGCRFRNPLSEAQCAALEIEQGQDRTPALD